MAVTVLRNNTVLNLTSFVTAYPDLNAASNFAYDHSAFSPATAGLGSRILADLGMAYYDNTIYAAWSGIFTDPAYPFIGATFSASNNYAYKNSYALFCAYDAGSEGLEPIIYGLWHTMPANALTFENQLSYISIPVANFVGGGGANQNAVTTIQNSFVQMPISFRSFEYGKITAVVFNGTTMTPYNALRFDRATLCAWSGLGMNG